MKRQCLRVLSLVLFVTIATCAVGYGQPGMRVSSGRPGNEISVSYFYDHLADDGQWFHDPTYGWCWTPYDVSADWRPYTDGRWEYTDYGWSWASNEPWGWATYHYGRWFFDDSYGWTWVPGTEWAPAWVAWRYGDDYVGWAPLPPTANWDASSGLAFADPATIQTPAWCFVPQRRMLDVSISLQVTSVARNVTLFGRSRDATRYEVRDGRPAEVGFDVTQVERAVGRPVPRVRIDDVATPVRGGQPDGHGAVGFFRPRVQPTTPDQAPVPTLRPRGDITDQERQYQRGQQQEKLESDLRNEHARLARDQASELRSGANGPGADEIRQRQAAEQQAFDAHAAQQRQVLATRIDKQVMRPGRSDRSMKPGNNGNNGKGNGRGNGKGNGKDKGQDVPGK